MKYRLAPLGITLALCSFAVAQERIVVPASNTAQPRKLDVHLMQGNVLIRAYNGKEVIVETGSSREQERGSERTINGMRRIDLPPRGLTIEEENNIITVRNRMGSSMNLTISVPADTSLTAKTMNGHIE